MVMNKEYIKFLKFRTELIELLDKYKYQISGTNLDNGSMNIENKNGVAYVLRDSYSDYEALDFDCNLLSTDYILNMFPEDNNSPINNDNIGIFSNSYDKVYALFSDLYNQNKENVKRFRKSKEEINLILENGRYFVWIKPIDNSRGWRCSKIIYIDRNLTLNELQYNVMPICCYCKREDVRVF